MYSGVLSLVPGFSSLLDETHKLWPCLHMTLAAAVVGMLNTNSLSQFGNKPFQKFSIWYLTAGSHCVLSLSKTLYPLSTCSNQEDKKLS